MNNRVIWAIVALAGGFLIGKNWDKIKKKVMPYAEKATQKVVKGADEAKKFLEEQKAKVIKEPKPVKRATVKVKAKA